MDENLLCFAGVAFSGRFTQPRELLLALATFGVFCAASSGIYAFNDVIDREHDRRHPLKRNRPVASGVVGAGIASVISIALEIIALAGTLLLVRSR